MHSTQTVTVINSLQHELHTPTAVFRSIQPSTLCETVKWLPAFRLSNHNNSNNKRWWWMWTEDSQSRSVGLVWDSAVACVYQKSKQGHITSLTHWLMTRPGQNFWVSDTVKHNPVPTLIQATWPRKIFSCPSKMIPSLFANTIDRSLQINLCCTS